MPLLLFLMLSLFGCGVNPVSAPRAALRPPELKVFPKQDWRLVNNKFFLWRTDMTPAHAARANAIGNDIDRLDGLALPNNRRLAELERAMEPVKEEVKRLETHCRSIRAAHEKLKGKIAKLEKEAPKESPELLSLKDQEGDIAPIRTALEAELKEREAALQPLAAEQEAVEKRAGEIETEGRAKVDEIMTIVDWFKDQPSAVVFQFRGNGKIDAEIAGWNLNDDAGPRNFSTQPGEGGKPTITGVTYEEKGGIFTFDAQVYADDAQKKLLATYGFRIARIKYEAMDRNFFGGEIVAKLYRADGSYELRRGLAKLVDRNN